MDKIFKLKEHHTDVKTEILAGLTTFMTMAYVLAVQPGAIVGAEATITDCNVDVISKSAILVMCALISGLVTILMAFYANMPFALSTGMGTNFLLGTMIQSGTMSFGSAMVITLISGVIFVALTVLGLRDIIVRMIPKNIKTAISAPSGSSSPIWASATPASAASTVASAWATSPSPAFCWPSWVWPSSAC